MWYLIVFIASILVSAAVTPKPEKPKPSGLNDIQVPTAEPGRAIPIIFEYCVVWGFKHKAN